MSYLAGPSRQPRSGVAESVVILLHGYGADGEDLIGIGDALADHMPNTLFMAPDAPEPCSINPMGRQWFPIPWMDGSTEAQMAESFDRSVRLLHAYLDSVAEETGVPAAQTALIGFSQGTMMALHVGLRRPEQLAGIVGFSGRLLAPERLPAELASRPPVLLVHGDMDEVVPPSSLDEAREALADAGVPVATHVSRGMGHGIAPDGLGLALRFLQERLG
ncbi:alpha/beta hydrolase [Oceanicella actignis]|uniref:Phospholipase/carboxylesterase n=1 Tax=Oceanicella actignis TaxID=1189325 RepID=A0A1M7SQS7_9RHOB|nr:dienelactone hydrolase family protein [Oceanicella actignis]SES67100.1 phospholipase/carboxylesterase [Oceanicella actignis]SHN60819.1 phospholipase/carboxylesterase [Oceanicella actignis]